MNAYLLANGVIHLYWPLCEPSCLFFWYCDILLWSELFSCFVLWCLRWATTLIFSMFQRQSWLFLRLFVFRHTEFLSHSYWHIHIYIIYTTDYCLYIELMIWPFFSLSLLSQSWLLTVLQGVHSCHGGGSRPLGLTDFWRTQDIVFLHIVSAATLQTSKTKMAPANK